LLHCASFEKRQCSDNLSLLIGMKVLCNGRKKGRRCWDVAKLNFCNWGFYHFFAFWVICITLHNNVHFGRKISVCTNIDDSYKNTHVDFCHWRHILIGSFSPTFWSFKCVVLFCEKQYVYSWSFGVFYVWIKVGMSLVIDKDLNICECTKI